MFTFIAHLGTFYYYVHVLSHLSKIDVTKHNDQALLDFKDFLGKYFTIWCFWIQTILFGVCLLHDVTRHIFPKSRSREVAYYFKNLVFTSLAAPISIAVSLSFWAIWNLDRELIMPTVMDKIIPMWLNHALHTVISLLVVVELLAEKHRVPALRHSCLALGACLCAYLFVFFHEHAQSGRWIYPIFKVLDWPGRIIFTVSIVSATFLLMGLFRKVVQITWPDEHLHKKLR